VKGYIIITKKGKYLLFAATKNQAEEHFKVYSNEKIILVFEVHDYDNIYILDNEYTLNQQNELIL
jgi:CO dehydrogenase/acetyl-CoA synthase gamma subunit (corrinoid Fe-S protein)